MRRSRHAPEHSLTAGRVRQVAQHAENAGFTLATFEDALLPPGADGVAGRIGAMERAAFAAATTTVLGVAPVVATTYTEPFHVASQLASLDFVSTGRGGWVVAATPEPAAALGRPVVDGEAGPRREARATPLR